MLVGLISDTHDRMPLIRKGVDLLVGRNVAAIVHPGDIVAPFAARLLREKVEAAGLPLHVVYGNNDGERAGLKNVLPQIQDGPLHVTLDGCLLLIHHALEWCNEADIERADVVVTGHTHEVAIERRGGRLLVNPGECCGWVTGTATVGVLDTATRTVDILQLAE